MSTLGPKKSLLKFKSTPSNVTSGQANSKPINVADSVISKQKQQKQLTTTNTHKKQQQSPPQLQPQFQQQQPTIFKTQAQKSFDLIKKHRIIHKMTDKAKISNKQRLQKRNKLLSKLPDHFDLARTGEKIQKGY